jgi:protein FRA10AC1
VLRTLELPFGYVEQGKVKSALVKVVLCEKCVKKIMWKREQLKKNANEQLDGSPGAGGGPDATRANKPDYEGSNHNSDHSVSRKVARSPPEQESRRRRRSRSRSPGRRSTRDRPKD